MQHENLRCYAEVFLFLFNTFFIAFTANIRYNLHKRIMLPGQGLRRAKWHALELYQEV